MGVVGIPDPFMSNYDPVFGSKKWWCHSLSTVWTWLLLLPGLFTWKSVACLINWSSGGKLWTILYNGWTILQQLYQIATQSVTFATFESIIIWVQSERQTRFLKKNTWLCNVHGSTSSALRAVVSNHRIWDRILSVSWKAL